MKAVSTCICPLKAIAADLFWGSLPFSVQGTRMHTKSKIIHCSLAAAIEIQVLGVFRNETINTGILVIRAVRQF